MDISEIKTSSLTQLHSGSTELYKWKLFSRDRGRKKNEGCCEHGVMGRTVLLDLKQRSRCLPFQIMLNFVTPCNLRNEEISTVNLHTHVTFRSQDEHILHWRHRKFCIYFIKAPLHFFNKEEIITKIEFHHSLVHWAFYLNQRRCFEYQRIWGSLFLHFYILSWEVYKLTFYCVLTWSL